MQRSRFNKVFVSCPTVGCKGDWRIDHLGSKEWPMKQVTWACKECGLEYKITVPPWYFQPVEIEPTGKRQTMVTVTLTSDTVPPITVKLHTWKYAHSQDDSPEEYFSHEQYFYETHTCPTNWTSEIDQMSIPGDSDPHGLFKLVSIVDGHEEDPGVIK